MSPDRDDLAYLWDMLTSAKAVSDFVRDRSIDDYMANLMLRSAVERQVEIIGEAARRISKEFQEAHPAIPWRPIQAQRHVLAHDYGEIKHDRIWRVATEHIPELIAFLTPLIPQSRPSGESVSPDDSA